jgi:ribosomal protein L30/L7E
MFRVTGLARRKPSIILRLEALRLVLLNEMTELWNMINILTV